jgi:adenylate cyclase
MACAQSLSGTFKTHAQTVSLALHAGDAICGDVGGEENRTFSAVGDVVNTARRMLDVAAEKPGGIVISDAMLDRDPASGSAISTGVDLGDVKLRGRDAPVHLWRISP